ncbi:hypothetical protein GUJ93_ZPchr0001g32163 [Zizania palustris]|uniref:Uncharacterized protein n=1 Tax=Zizania palustris TaxID=103762 RepID=A0A8J5RFM5_ZIZPA|nr:hypothetical protein GUJ93_ZPchr0001g32163 [Zizania palustris]
MEWKKAGREDGVRADRGAGEETMGAAGGAAVLSSIEPSTMEEWRATREVRTARTADDVRVAASSATAVVESESGPADGRSESRTTAATTSTTEAMSTSGGREEVAVMADWKKSRCGTKEV